MERVTWKLTLPCVKQIANRNFLYVSGISCMSQETQTGSLYQSRRMGWGGRREGVQKGGDICIPITDSC